MKLRARIARLKEIIGDENNQARPTSRRTPQSREVNPGPVDEAKSDLQIENEKRLERLKIENEKRLERLRKRDPGGNLEL